MLACVCAHPCWWLLDSQSPRCDSLCLGEWLHAHSSVHLGFGAPTCALGLLPVYLHPLSGSLAPCSLTKAVPLGSDTSLLGPIMILGNLHSPSPSPGPFPRDSCSLLTRASCLGHSPWDGLLFQGKCKEPTLTLWLLIVIKRLCGSVLWLNIFHDVTLNFNPNHPPVRQMLILIVPAKGRLTTVSISLGFHDDWAMELGLN